MPRSTTSPRVRAEVVIVASVIANRCRLNVAASTWQIDVNANRRSLLELRQNASEILREVEAGEAATVTVAGRPVSHIVPIRAEQWTTWERIRQVFDTPTDSTWDDERRARRLARLSAILRSFEPLSVDAGEATSYGELAAATHRAGRKATARSVDLMIAATAHAHGARLVTSNARDVNHLVGLVEIIDV